MTFGGIQRTSTIDFPGVLCCVLFTRGCNLDCFYCHNRALLHPGPPVPESTVLDFLERRRGLLDGVVVSGGEPLLQPDLRELLQRLKRMGYRVKLDSNGQRTGQLLELVDEGLVDYVAIDVKAAPEDYPAVCRGALDPTRETLLGLLARAVPFEARTTLYPGMTAQQLLRALSAVPALPRWTFNYFRMPEEYLPEDAARLALPALTPLQVRWAAAELLAVQPGLLLEDR